MDEFVPFVDLFGCKTGKKAGKVFEVVHVLSVVPYFTWYSHRYTIYELSWMSFTCVGLHIMIPIAIISQNVRNLKKLKS